MNSQSDNANEVVLAETNAAHGKFAMMDVGKILAAAMLSGLIFCSIATGLILLLMSGAEARNLSKDNLPASANNQPNRVAKVDLLAELMPSAELVPGVFYAGDGCTRAPVAALDRDWRIRINGSMAEVRVMQSFLMPADGPAVANFRAELPSRAILSSLRVDSATSASVQTAQMMTNLEFAAMSSAKMRALRKSNRLMVLINGRQLETDSILHLVPGETVTVEYTYMTPVGHANSAGLVNLNLVLQAKSAQVSAITTGTVWVEWIDAHPKNVVSQSNDIFIEETAGRISGASWYSADLSMTRQFNLTWDRLQ